MFVLPVQSLFNINKSEKTISQKPSGLHFKNSLITQDTFSPSFKGKASSISLVVSDLFSCTSGKQMKTLLDTAIDAGNDMREVLTAKNLYKETLLFKPYDEVKVVFDYVEKFLNKDEKSEFITAKTYFGENLLSKNVSDKKTQFIIDKAIKHEADMESLLIGIESPFFYANSANQTKLLFDTGIKSGLNMSKPFKQTHFLLHDTILQRTTTAEQRKVVLDYAEELLNPKEFTNFLMSKNKYGQNVLHTSTSADETKVLLDTAKKAGNRKELLLSDNYYMTKEYDIAGGRTALFNTKTVDQAKVLIDAAKEEKVVKELLEHTDVYGSNLFHEISDTEIAKFYLDTAEEAGSDVRNLLTSRNQYGWTAISNADYDKERKQLFFNAIQTEDYIEKDELMNLFT